MKKDLLIKNGIDVESGIELLGDIEMYNDTLQDFMDEIDERLSKIEEYKKNDDMENYAIEVHAMKGDSKYLGFTKLAELSLNHQTKSQENDSDYVNEHYDELVTEANRIKQIVSEYLNL